MSNSELKEFAYEQINNYIIIDIILNCIKYISKIVLLKSKKKGVQISDKG